MARRKKMTMALRSLGDYTPDFPVDPEAVNVGGDGGAFDMWGALTGADSQSTIYGTDSSGAVLAPPGFTLADVGKLVTLAGQIYKLVQSPATGQLVIQRQASQGSAMTSVTALLKNPVVLLGAAYLILR